MANELTQQLSKINGQASVLEKMDEKAVEFGVVLPLLGQLGWDTTNVSEIYPQWQLPSGGKVDFDLKIGGKSRAFIEVKNWTVELKGGGEPEKQLEKYCREAESAAKPSLAVLTNGRQWRFYLPPLSRNRRDQPFGLREFLEFDITNDSEQEVEGYLQQFLARQRFLQSSYTRTEKDAKALFDAITGKKKVMADLTSAWNELSVDERALVSLLTNLAESQDIQATNAQIKEFINSNDPLVNQVSKTKGPMSFPRPTEFTLKPSENDAPIEGNVPKNKGWNEFLVILCELMRERHPATFNDVLSGMPQWFSQSSEFFKYSSPVGDGEWYIKYGGREDIKVRSQTVVEKFGYPKNALIIQEN